MLLPTVSTVTEFVTGRRLCRHPVFYTIRPPNCASDSKLMKSQLVHLLSAKNGYIFQNSLILRSA